MSNSTDILSSSIQRRLRHLMVRTLDEYDRRFENDNSDASRLFKFDIKNMFNDAIRATRDEMSDYQLLYRPISLSNDGTLSVTKDFADSIESVDFKITDSIPMILITSTKDRAPYLEAIRMEFGVGIAYLENDKCYYAVSGVDSCIAITALFDRYRLPSSVRQKYTSWRSELVHLYVRS